MSESAALAGEDWQAWVGRKETIRERIAPDRVAALSATLGIEGNYAAGAPLPPGWHWIFFNHFVPRHELGTDGHPRRGGFLPPVSLPRRMWAGGRLQFERALRVGDAIERRSTITKVDAKHGRSGALVFVTVRHEIADARGVAITEEHDIVYRDHPQPGAPAPAATPAPTGEAFSRTIVPDPVLLFRYSALTFNGHRIHYDRTYVTEVEGYPGLIVHGPLIATLLVDLVRRELPEARIRAFTFKAARPLFDIHPFMVCGKRGDDGVVSLWARNHEGRLAMQARAELA